MNEDALDEAPVNDETIAPIAEREAAIASSAGLAQSPTPSDVVPEPAQYVYALGTIEPRFPSPSIEKEFAQAASREDTSGLTDRQTLRRVLSARENRYLLRKMCWVFRIEGLETYLLLPRDPGDLELLLEAVRSEPGPSDMDVIIGLRGPLAPPAMCNGLTLPIVALDHVYSFSQEALLAAIPKPPEADEGAFRATAAELLNRIVQLADNAGATDEHRALNYLVVRYPAIYATALTAFERDDALSGVEAKPSALSGGRNLVEVIFSFTNRNTDVTEKFFVRVDVTEEFPFLVTKMSSYYDR